MLNNLLETTMAVLFSRGSYCHMGSVRLLSMGFPRPGFWNGLPFSSPGDLLDPGIEPGSLALQEDSSHLSHQGSPTVAVVVV